MSQSKTVEERVFAALRAVAPPGGNVVFSPMSLLACADLCYKCGSDAVRAQLAPYFAASAQLDPALCHGAAVLVDSPLNAVTTAPAGAVVFREADRALLVSRVNAWVADVTRGAIPTLLSPGDQIDACLLGAVFFKARWEHIFDAQRTQEEDFFALPTALFGFSFYFDPRPTCRVQMMHKKPEWMYARETSAAVAAVLPYECAAYQSPEYVAVVAVPRGADMDAAMALALDADYKKWQYREVDVALPRFRLDCKCDLMPHLRDEFPALFDPFALARLTSIAHATTKIMQRVVLDVDELGTVVAAVTAMCLEAQSGRINPPPPLVVRADRPFAFVVRSLRHGVVVCAEIRNPTQ